MQRTRTSFVSLIGLLALSGCLGDPFSSEGSKPGLGNSTAMPTGTPFVLPAGLELEKKPHSYSYYEDEYCPDVEEVEIHGSGFLVTLCFLFRNTTQEPIDLVLPPGLIFISESTDLQNGLLTELVTVEIPPSTVMPVVVASYCANSSRSAPGGGDLYSIGPITDDPDVLELLAMLDGLDLPGKSLYASPEEINAITTVQAAVWDVTSNGELEETTRAALEALLK